MLFFHLTPVHFALLVFRQGIYENCIHVISLVCAFLADPLFLLGELPRSGYQEDMTFRRGKPPKAYPV